MKKTMKKKLSKFTLNETVVNTSNFSSIKVKGPCRQGIFDMFPNDVFIIVLEDGTVVMYEYVFHRPYGYYGHGRKPENVVKNTFENLREFISLYGSKFFSSSILTGENVRDYADGLKTFYEGGSGVKIRDIYQYPKNKL